MTPVKDFVRRSAAVLAIPLTVVLCAGTARAQTATQQREAAVLKARAGRTAEAVVDLRAMLAAGIDDGLVAMDLVTVLQQEGKAAEAVALFEQAVPANPPEYALVAITRAYRDLRRTDDAVRLARQGLLRFPEQPVWPLLLSLALTDAGSTDEALALLREPTALRASPIERLLAEAYAWRRAPDPFKALDLYTEAIRLAPADATARNEAAAVLQELNAPYGAAQLAGVTPPIAAQQAAAMVRDGEMRLDDLTNRFEGTDAALMRLDVLLVETAPTDTETRRRLRLDRLVALRNRARMEEVRAEGDALRAEAPLPLYAEEPYAEALLSLRQPKEAREAYRRILAQSSSDVQARYGVFYASVELDDFSTAYAAIDALVGDEPVWRGFQDDPTRYSNPERAHGEVTAALARYYGNQLADAWARITRISQAAPANPEARIAASQISSSRGWMRRATAEAEIAGSLAPGNVGSRIALAETAAANYRLSDADRIAGDLMVQYPENQSVRRLTRDLGVNRRWVFGFDAEPSDSEGGGANASGEAITLQGRLTSPPLADHWRIFVLSDYSNAHPPEGYVDRVRAGLGVEWRTSHVTATVFPTQSSGSLSKSGVGATADWLVSDQVQLSVAAEQFTWDTPLRALLQGISANDYSLRATYRWHESRNVTANIAYQPFSDGNRRVGGGLAYRELLVNRPSLDIAGVLEASASRNTISDAPYYNPARDLSVIAGTRMEHLAWRRYDISLTQSVSADAGIYAQRGFNDDWLATLSYEHRWRFDPLTSFRYGVQLSRRVYDGIAENTLTFTTGLAQRF